MTPLGEERFTHLPQHPAANTDQLWQQVIGLIALACRQDEAAKAAARR